LPVIAVESPGGIRDLLGAGKYGVLVAPGGVEALGEALAATLQNRAQLQVFSRNAPLAVKKNEIGIIAGAWLDLFRRVSQRKPAPIEFPISLVDDGRAPRVEEKTGKDRFSFGENWLAFLEHLDEQRIAEAEGSLQALCTLERLDGKRFLDIGSGSGLSSLAARRLGAVVHSFDYDPQSVAGTQKLKDRFFPNDTFWTVEQGSILDPSYVDTIRTYDIVYSWGVLHHTGAMKEAIANAASRVKDGGLLVFALYRKTRLCRLWAIEKRWYINATPAAQKFARAVFTSALHLAFLVTRRDFQAYVENYKGSRGMSFVHDVHDWMGGYPYESITSAEVTVLMNQHRFEHIRSNVRPYETGVFGSGCDEYVYRRANP
jgi:2-polyprenyl-3-methyl-5-hydroxy-6-metoxy-1,4-benzoquinol methylase